MKDEVVEEDPIICPTYPTTTETTGKNQILFFLKLHIQVNLYILKTMFLQSQEPWPEGQERVVLIQQKLT